MRTSRSSTAASAFWRANTLAWSPPAASVMAVSSASRPFFSSVSVGVGVGKSAFPFILLSTSSALATLSVGLNPVIPALA
ncbi:MAG: hypothetical protein IPP83_00855 [Flavobacteriales bacterium]|nr:hypothetical protein [Flavobacteriales bacterium]